MRFRLLVLTGLAVVAAAGLLSGWDAAFQDPVEDVESSTIDPAEMQRLWSIYCTPTKEHHKPLWAFVGDWEATTRGWWEGQDKDPIVSHGRIHSEMVFGGRFLRTELDSTVTVQLGGKAHEIPVQGIGFIGYNTFAKKYTQIWIDSNDTRIYVSHGTADAKGRTFRYFGNVDDWMKGETDKACMGIDRIVDQDTIISEIHDMTLPEGETKIMEVEARRVGAKAVAKAPGDPVAALQNAAVECTVAQLDPDDASRLLGGLNLPGPEHELLKAFAGDWTVATVASWRGDMKPEESNAKIQSTLIFGGRFLQTELESTMKIKMNGEEREVPVEGIGFVGYNTFTKKYTQVWIDSNNTQMFISEGTADASGRVFRYIGSMDEWMSGQHKQPFLYVDRIIDDATIISEIHDLMRQVKVMEMESRRVTIAKRPP